jgi:hypothetical protein
VGGGDSGPRGQFGLGTEVVFAGFLRGDVWYFGISFVSDITIFPREMKGLDERFPPLRERIAHWSTERLVVESKRSLRAEVIPGWTIGRNRLLVREAVTRGDLTVGMFEDLLSRGVGNGLTLGNVIVPDIIEAAIEKHVVGRFATVINQYLERLPQRNKGLEEADVILRALSAEEDIDLESQAIHVLLFKNRLAISGSLEYLRLRGRTLQARDAVAALDLDEWLQRRDAVLAAINRRIRDQP